MWGRTRGSLLKVLKREADRSFERSDNTNTVRGCEESFSRFPPALRTLLYVRTSVSHLTVEGGGFLRRMGQWVSCFTPARSIMYSELWDFSHEFFDHSGLLLSDSVLPSTVAAACGSSLQYLVLLWLLWLLLLSSSLMLSLLTHLSSTIFSSSRDHYDRFPFAYTDLPQVFFVRDVERFGAAGEALISPGSPLSLTEG